MPWQPDIFIPLDDDDPRNVDRFDPGGDRVRLRLNREGGRIVDFVVQYETPVANAVRTHEVVLRSDMTHEPHCDLYDQFGAKRVEWLEAYLSPPETVKQVLRLIKTTWPELRLRFYQGFR